MIKDYSNPIEKTEQDLLLGIKRGKALHKKIFGTFPIEVTAQLSLSLDYGPSLIRAFIYLETDCSVAETRLCSMWLLKTFGAAAREFREATGVFYWTSNSIKMLDDDGKYDVLVMVENANAGNCTIKQVEKTVTVYETDCKPKKEEK